MKIDSVTFLDERTLTSLGTTMRKLLPIIGVLSLATAFAAGTALSAGKIGEGGQPAVEVISRGIRSSDGQVLFAVNLFRLQDGTPLVVEGISSAVSEVGLPELQSTRFDAQMFKTEFETLEFGHGPWTLYASPVTNSWASVADSDAIDLVLEHE